MHPICCVGCINSVITLILWHTLEVMRSVYDCGKWHLSNEELTNVSQLITNSQLAHSLIDLPQEFTASP